MIDGKIYKVTNVINGKAYVGQTIRPLQERFDRHLRDAINNKYPENHFHRAIRKYGAENFVIEQIDSASTQNELNEKEIYWISKLNSIDLGYNTAIGGEGGNTYKGRTKKQMEITKELISISNTGKNNGMSRSIKCKSTKTGEEHLFETLAECLSFFNIKNKETLSKRATGENKLLYKGEWLFAYPDNDYITDYIEYYDSSCRHGRKTILQSDIEELKFNSINKALAFLGLPKSIGLMDGMIIKGYKVIIS